VRSRLSYLAFRIGVGLIGALPRRAAIGIGSWAAWLVAPLLRGRWAMARRHGRRLGVEEAALDAHARRVFASYGRYWAETFWVRPERRASIEATTEAVGLEVIEEAVKRGGGMVFALPHIGNWEFAGPIAGWLGFELFAVAENLANHRIRDWFVGLRRQMGIDVILVGRTTTRELESVLARNGAVALLCDRDLRGKGVTVEFFGEPTTIPAGPVRLAVRTGATLIPVASYFTPAGGHVVHIEPAIPIDPDQPDALAEGSQRLAAALERLIRRDPGQWHLLQPNWPSDRQPAP
jgi:phosphatidylinositol dimannoside acyltransferase